MSPKTLIAAMALVTACSAATRGPLRPVPNPSRVIAQLQEQSQGLQSMALSARFDVKTAQDRYRLRQVVSAARPDRLRIDTFSPLGETLSTLILNGPDIDLLDLKAGRWFHGAANAKTLGEMISIPIPPDTLIPLLLGGVPSEVLGAGAQWSEDGQIYVVTIQKPTLTWTLEYPKTSLALVKSKVVALDTGVVHTVWLEEFEDVGHGLDLPKRIRVTASDQDQEIQLRVDDREINGTLDATLFVLQPRAGLVREEWSAHAP